MNALPDPVSPAWGKSVTAVMSEFRTDPARGLEASEVRAQRLRWGSNAFETARPRPLASILAAQFRSLVVLLLIGAGSLAVVFADLVEGLAIFAVILINAGIGFTTEWRATRSMEALRQFVRIDCVVLRNGEITRLPAAELVPGDIVLLEAGDLVPADLRLIAAAKLAADESTLTGESLPVDKHCRALAANTPLLQRQNMVYKGTAITRGTGRGVVVATGMQTEFGRIFEQVAGAAPRQTPLEKRLEVLGRWLVWGVLGIAILVAAAGIARGRDAFLAVEVAIALAVAAIPEGLPIVATIALARGVWRMAKRNALVTRLSAVETLGATSIILTDKTGTLTENRMAVTSLLLEAADVTVTGADRPARATFDATTAAGATAAAVDELLTVAALCNNASLERNAGAASGVGDPTELALLFAASGRDIWREDLAERMPEIREDPFDPAKKRMATVHELNGSRLVAVKGAPETVIAACSGVRSAGGRKPLGREGRQRWLDRVDAFGRAGLRTLAIASKRSADAAADPYEGLDLLGIVGLEDPPRQGVGAALAACRSAGIGVVMVTGDHASTAEHVAVKLGLVPSADTREHIVDGSEFDGLLADGRVRDLLSTRIFSRVSPEQKFTLIGLFQDAGEIVAMTGDGVNDAPALKKADIGVAMGVRGTAVAKEAAEMILTDDDFGTIVTAVEQGRAIFENIRKFVVYLLSCNISEVLVVALATLAGAPLPLLPLQILFLNLVTDVFPALALGVGRGSPGLMAARPRAAGEDILLRRHWFQILLYGALLAAVVLAAMATAVVWLELGRAQAVTVAFLTLALAQVGHVFNMRGDVRRFVSNEITTNRWVWAAVALCLALVLAAVHLPGLAGVLQLVDPGYTGWLVVAGASLAPLLMAPAVRAAAARLALYRRRRAAIIAPGPRRRPRDGQP